MSKIVTIHQPDFMPWLGLYNKISKVDEFVVLDHVLNNPRDSGFWCRRVQMMIGGVPSWIAVPLVREKGRLAMPINEMRINTTQDELLQKTFLTIRMHYSRAPFFRQVFPIVEKYFTSIEANLSLRNFSFLKETLEALHIHPQIIFSSALDCKMKSTRLLIEILQKRSGTEYICGAGASGYQEDALLNQANIKVTHNSFQHPEYPQFNSAVFKKGLSIIDVLMNIGYQATENLIRFNS